MSNSVTTADLKFPEPEKKLLAPTLGSVSWEELMDEIQPFLDHYYENRKDDGNRQDNAWSERFTLGSKCKQVDGPAKEEFQIKIA